MRRTNINAVLRMVREYLNGDMNEIDFYLDFPYEIEKRYQKMCREDPDYADLIYYYLVENGTDLHRSMTSEEFHDHIQTQYDNVMDGVCSIFLSRPRIAAGILLPLNTGTLLYPGGRSLYRRRWN